MTLQEQRVQKPPYERLSALVLSGGAKERLDRFIGQVQSMKLKPKWYATNAYNVKYRGKMIFRFTMNAEQNTVSLFFTISDVAGIDAVLEPLPEGMKQFYFDHFRACTHCNPAHSGRKVTVLGRDCVCCAEPEMRVDDPTDAEYGMLLRFVPVRKEKIVAGVA